MRLTVRDWIRNHWAANGGEWVKAHKHLCDETIGERVPEETWARAIRKVRSEQEKAGKGSDYADSLVSSDVDTEGKAELYHSVDPSQWQPAGMVVNTWGSPDNPNQQVKMRYEVRQALTPESFAEKVDAVLSTIKPKYPKIKPPKVVQRHTAEVMIPDFHTGARVWGDAKKAGEEFFAAVEHLMRPYRPGEFGTILFPIGNDYLNWDNWNLTTTAGTQLDTSDRPDVVIDEGIKALIRAIDYLRQFAPVDAVLMPGNHDWLLSHMMARVLSAWYNDEPNIHIDTDLQEWKIRSGPNWLLALTHGKSPHTKRGMKAEELAKLLPHKAPEEWARSTYREVQTGHYHGKQYGDHNGVMVRRVSSLKPRDEREEAHGYMNGREAELLIFDDNHVSETRSYRP